MAGICFYFENNDIDVWSGHSIYLDAWNYSSKLTPDIDKIVIINKTSQNLQPFDISIETTITNEYPNLEGHLTQIVCPWENTPESKINLWDFNHQTDWYLFGPAAGWGNNYFANSYLTIPQHGQAACHSIHIANLITFHRYKTLWL